jgi:flagellar basal body-associated protein FliL
MFRSKTRKIEELQGRLGRVLEQRDFHQHRADSAQAVTTRNAALYAETDELNAFLNDQIHGYQNVLTRHARLLRACARYRNENRSLRQELAAQRTEMTSRLLALETSNEALRAVNEKHYAELADKAGATPAPALHHAA